MTAPQPNVAFPETRWSAVLRLRREKGSEGAPPQALSELCAAYWFPLYAFARRAGHPPEDAEDLTQGFFARLLERELFAQADPARGRLRSFVLGAFKHFMSEEWRRENRQKRGGHQVAVPLDEATAEELYRAGLIDDASPDVIFERTWFQTLLQNVHAALAEEWRKAERTAQFRRLQEFLAWNSAETRIAEAARELEMSPGAVRVAIHRLRHRFRQLLEEHVVDTVASAADAEEEMQRLRQVLGG